MDPKESEQRFEVVLNRNGKMVRGQPGGLRAVVSRIEALEGKMDSIHSEIEEVRKILPSPIAE